MESTENILINENEVRFGETMSYISFEELVRELTGTSLESMYREYERRGGNNEQGNME